MVQTGFLDCQEFALEVQGASLLQSPPPLNRRLGTNADFSGTYSAVDYGKHWTVLKSSGLIQCLVRGRPETLFSLPDAKKVTVHNPRDMREGAHYYIALDDEESRVVLQAECPSDHFDWVLSIERVLQEKGLQGRLCGDRGKQSGYVTLKQLMKMQEGGELGDRGSGMQLYAMPRVFNTLDDVYEPPREISTPQELPPRNRKRLDYENQSPPSPPSPPTYVNFIPPPPLPPRASAPPLPPKGVLRSLSSRTPSGKNSTPPDGNDEYIVMHPQSLPPTPLGPTSTNITSPPHFSPTTPNGAHHLSRLEIAPVSSQPITIPNHRPGKQSKLLRSDSEFSSCSINTLDSPFPEIQECASPPSVSHSQQSSSRSLPRRSSSSLHSINSLHRRQTSGTMDNSTTNAPPSNPGDGSSGYNSPLLSMSPSPGMRRSQSNRFVKQVELAVPRPHPGDVSQSDGMVVAEVKGVGVHHPVSQAGSVSLSVTSDGYSSSHSSTDDMAQVNEKHVVVCVCVCVCVCVYACLYT